MIGLEAFTMSNKAVRYTPEFKRQMVELVRSGRMPASLAKEFGPTPWVKQDERDTGKGDED
jgi:transposase